MPFVLRFNELPEGGVAACHRNDIATCPQTMGRPAPISPLICVGACYLHTPFLLVEEIFFWWKKSDRKIPCIRPAAAGKSSVGGPLNPGYNSNHVRVLVPWPRSDRGRRGRGGAAVRPREHDARRLAQHFAEADAVTCPAAIRRYNRHHVHDLDDGKVTRSG